MSKGFGKGGDYDVPEVEEPDPVAPASPASRGSQEAAQAAEEEKNKAKKKFGQNKTILSRGSGLTGTEDNNKTLG